MKKSGSVRYFSAHLSCTILTAAAAFGLASATAAEPNASSELANQGSVREMLSRVRESQGVAVVLGDPECELALALAAGTEFLIYLQFADPARVLAARRLADAKGLNGRRLFIDGGPLNKLQLADGLADVLCAMGPAADMPGAEALRVLRPRGRAFLGRKELIKPVPEGVDDWSHPYHGPDNNPASTDQLARGPYLTRFLSDPRYAPLPQAALASAGRVFKLFGHIAFKEREEPWLNTMAAFNGYNGALLWRRPIPEGLMIHRNTFIATPDVVYFGDDQSCKIIDAATGELRDEVVVPRDVVDGTFWKWMALENGVLYAMVGEQEQRDPNIRMRSDKHGWPWDPLSPGFNQPEHPWGYGRSLVALDPQTKSILWQHREAEPFDSRATCMKDGRVFLFRHGEYLVCLDAKTGQEVWRKTKDSAPEVFAALGPDLPRQDWRTNWRTTAYVKCSSQALYFSGPTINQLLALSATDGRILWQHPYNNYQLVLGTDGLYALSGQIDSEPSRKFDPLTGQVLEEIKLGRRACTRPTGAIDAIFCRASGGSTRLDLATAEPELVSPMRAQCQDGVTVGNGLLYWWPSVCDCNLTLYGITCLGPAGDFAFGQEAKESERLEISQDASAPVAGVSAAPNDWPTFRADNVGSASTGVEIPSRVQRLWQTVPTAELTPTSPTTAAGMIFCGGSDGSVQALDARTGAPRWKAYTGGGLRFPPTFWNGRLFAGSGDGWAYCFEARTGRMLWRFRAAPAERKIPVYGQLLSTWPVASGLLVQDGVAYLAAGIVNYDGTHVYALDATTGRIKWQNNSSGHLDPSDLAGVSVQGHMIIHDGKLWLAGGNVVSPGVYDLRDGRCLNDVGSVHRLANNSVPSSEAPRGSALYLVGDQVMVSDQPLYAHPQFKVYDASVLTKTWFGSAGDRDVAWVNNTRLLCYPRLQEKRTERLVNGWGRTRLEGANPLWEAEFRDSVAVALGRNALVVARPSDIVAYDLQKGRPLWTHTLPGTPVPWGLALDRNGRVIVALQGGQILCYGPADLTASR